MYDITPELIRTVRDERLRKARCQRLRQQARREAKTRRTAR